MGKKIQNKVGALFHVEHSTLKPFQGDLKTLTEVNYLRLRNRIEKDGFNSPIHVWKDGEDLYTLDGHQRCRVLGKMEEEGYEIPEIPCVTIEADGIEQAKRILLSHASQYGEMDRQGLYEFMVDNQINIDEWSEGFNFPEIAQKGFNEEFFVDQGVRDPKGGPSGATEISSEEFEHFNNKCPRCSFEFN